MLSLFKPFFGVLTGGMSNLCDNASLITSYSTYGVKYIVLPVIGSSILNMEAKEKLDIKSLEIYPTLLKNL